jgi:AraC family transcriptional regulator
MDYREHIEHALEYIDANLETELSLSDLAKATGYSEYHFLRVFKQVTNLTPADYIRKRRLSEIAREMDESGCLISDLAFQYGFNSKENFTRAFKAEHNVLPTEYKSAGNSLKLFGRLRLDVASFEVKLKIMNMDSFSLTVFHEPCEEGYNPPKFWNMYNCKKSSLRLSGGKTVADYGIYKWDDVKKRPCYLIGIRTDNATGDTSGTVQFEIPSGLYAMVSTPPASHFDFVSTIHRTWGYILGVWMPQSEYEVVCGPQFETYVETSRTYSEDIYIPIKKKGATDGRG